MEELRKEFGSHLCASISGWDFAAGYGEVMAGIYTSAFLNANRDAKQHPAPFEVVMPWPGKQQAEEVTAEERAALRARLLRRSAFAQ